MFHPDAVKLTNSCNLVFLIDSTYKTNKYKLSLLDIVGVTPTRMTFSAGFAYLEGERLNNVVWALEWFQGLFMRADALPGVIVTNRDLSLMNAVKTVFPDATNLLCLFHIDKNVKAKCKTLVAQKNAWDYVMEAWGSLVDCPNESSFEEYLKKFEMACSLWPMVESTHWSPKRLLQNSVGDICNVWEAMNNMMTLQHIQIKTSFETSTHVVGHVFKVTLYKKLLGMVLRYALNEIAAEYERAKTLHDVDVSSGVPTVFHVHLDVCGKIHLKSKLRDIAYPDMNSMCPPPGKVKTKGAPKKSACQTSKVNKMRSVLLGRQSIPMLNQFHPCIQDSIENIIDVKADGNCGYCAIAALLGIGEESWSLVRNHQHKELSSWSEEYMNLVGGIERFEELKRSLLVTMDKWMNITDMGYIIASRYNIIVVSLSQKQSITFFPLRSQSPPDSSVHCVICIGHVYGNHFVQAKQWSTSYIARMQRYTSLSRLNTEFVDLGEP
ncbi:Protein FAR1-RELATED SEQUENCE 2 [Glycine soja]